MASQYPSEIKATKRGQAAVLKMSGPEIRINRIFLEQWMKALDEVESWPDVKALITTGSGNYYCNGLDFDYLLASSEVEFARYVKISRRFRERLLCFPMVTIAAINGHCIEAGLMIALFHDYRVLEKGRGHLSMNEGKGLRFNTFVKSVFKAKFSPKTIRDVFLFDSHFSAKQALKTGLVDEVADEGDLVSSAVEMANVLIRNRTYDRGILHDMKCDLYSNILHASDFLPGSLGKQMRSKLKNSKL